MAWYLWVDDNKVATNCSDLSTLSEKSAGFQGGKAAVAKNANVALRQANLVACALMDVIDSQSVLSYSNSRQEIAAQCSAYFNKFATLAALGNEENWLVANANNATNATNAEHATNAENTDFTNAEWIVAPDGGVDCSNLVSGATYEVVMLNGAPKTCIFTYFIGENGKSLNCGGILDISDTETQSGPDAKLYLSSRTIFEVSTSSDKLRIIKSVHIISDNSVTISAVYNFKYRRIR